MLQQFDTPRDLYDRPANLFVAGFIGSPAMNLLQGRLDGSSVHLGEHVVDIPGMTSRNAEVTIGVRPESMRLTTREDGGMPVEVTVVEELGADNYVYGTSDVKGTPHSVIVRVPGHRCRPRATSST